jgi:hypothetical protein
MATALQVNERLRFLADEAERLRAAAQVAGVLSEEDSARWVSAMCQLRKINSRAFRLGWTDICCVALATADILASVPSGAIQCNPILGLTLLKAKEVH